MAQSASKTPDRKTADRKTADRKTADRKTADRKTADRKGRRTVKRQATSRRAAANNRKVLRLVDYLPETERLAALKHAAERLDNVEHTQEILAAAVKVADAYRSFGSRVEEIEANAGERLDDAMARFADLSAVQSALGMSEKLGERATEELDEMLDRMGLMRKAVHESEITLLKKRHKSARKSAETKAKRAAEKEFRKQLRSRT